MNKLNHSPVDIRQDLIRGPRFKPKRNTSGRTCRPKIHVLICFYLRTIGSAIWCGKPIYVHRTERRGRQCHVQIPHWGRYCCPPRRQSQKANWEIGKELQWKLLITEEQNKFKLVEVRNCGSLKITKDLSASAVSRDTCFIAHLIRNTFIPASSISVCTWRR